MRSGRTLAVVSAALVIALVVWMANATEWVDTSVPLPLRGEASHNPFYGAQRFVEALGARAVRDETLTPPPLGAVLVVSDWRFDLSTRRRDTLTRWVESGGRLVVDATIAGDDAFGRWTGVTRTFRETDRTVDGFGAEMTQPSEPSAVERRLFGRPCRSVQEVREGPDTVREARTSYNWCDPSTVWFLASTTTPVWALRDQFGMQAVRVRVGQGSVTVFNTSLYKFRDMLVGDHAAIFAIATQLRRGDAVHFLTEADHPSLLALTWREGAPIVMWSLGALALALWRGAGRFGPLAAPVSPARRSLAEQIRGTGRFALRSGDAHVLYDSVVRALKDAARRRITRFDRLTEPELAAAIAALTHLDASALDAALHDPALRGPERLRSTVALLEHARRRALSAPVRSSYGTH